jgi:gamma-glutamylputrescine oxidase
VGFGGHGMNTAPIAANILSDWLTGSSEKLKVFERIPFAWNGGVFGPIAAELKYLYLKLIDKIS